MEILILYHLLNLCIQWKKIGEELQKLILKLKANARGVNPLVAAYDFYDFWFWFGCNKRRGGQPG